MAKCWRIYNRIYYWKGSNILQNRRGTMKLICQRFHVFLKFRMPGLRSMRAAHFTLYTTGIISKWLPQLFHLKRILGPGVSWEVITPSWVLEFSISFQKCSNRSCFFRSHSWLTINSRIYYSIYADATNTIYRFNRNKRKWDPNIDRLIWVVRIFPSLSLIHRDWFTHWFAPFSQENCKTI